MNFYFQFTNKLWFAFFHTTFYPRVKVTIHFCCELFSLLLDSDISRPQVDATMRQDYEGLQPPSVSSPCSHQVIIAYLSHILRGCGRGTMAHPSPLGDILPPDEMVPSPDARKPPFCQTIIVHSFWTKRERMVCWPHQQ